jgi:asparagine synthase (glutamine-hydrolysing)
MGAADLLTAAEVRNSALAQRFLRELGARVGVAVHAPFLDNRVVAACLRVRPADRADPWSCKPLLGCALDGLVPEPVFTRITKGNYTQEDYLGVRRAAGWLTELLADSRMADLGVIEPQRVRASLDRMRAGAATSVGALNQVIATELWLRGVE